MVQPLEIACAGAAAPAAAGVLGDAALAFLGELAREFTPRRDALLQRRAERKVQLRRGQRLDFLPETAHIRDADWAIEPVPRDLLKRVVEITGPVDRKMVINALNSGADVFMADFEDATSPTFANLVEGQQNLIDAVRRSIGYRDGKTGKEYRLAPETATLLVRPRGLHLPEAHALANGRPVPGALFDFGLYLFHNAHALLARGTGPYFYLPKLESHLEARWWNDVFTFAEARLDLPRGAIKATVLIETLPAAFEMHEILYELRAHAAGLNCGRWDYIFSYIKCHQHDARAVLPDRGQVTMEQPFLRAYTQLLVQTCHRRGAHAMGGMAAQIPIKNDPAAAAAALEKVRADKRREARDGHDGTWVAHPGLVALARETFQAHLRGDHQLDVLREDFRAGAADLLAVPTGTRTEAGLATNVRVGIRYLEAWLSGNGCVPLYHLMEDAATAEISRTQIWQWLHHGAALEDGRAVTRELVTSTIAAELVRIAEEVGAAAFSAGRYPAAVRLFEELCTAEQCPDFLTLAAYPLL